MSGEEGCISRFLEALTSCCKEGKIGQVKIREKQDLC